MNESWSAAWESALDDLELTLEETEHLLQGEQPLVDQEARSSDGSAPQVELPRPHERDHSDDARHQQQDDAPGDLPRDQPGGRHRQSGG